MKKIFLSALAVCTIFTSCTEEDKGASKNGEQSIYVQFLQETAYDETRAVEAPATAITETSLNNAIVFLLNGDAVVNSEEVTPADILAGYKKFDNVPSTVNGVMVVANVPSSAEITSLLAKTSVAEIERFPFTIAGQSSPGVTGKVMMGRDATLTVDVNPTSGDPDVYKKADIELRSITARFEIGNVIAGTGVKNVKLQGVWINNYIANGAATTPTLNGSTSTYWDIVPASNTVGSSTALIPSTIPAYSPAEYYNAHNATVDGTSFVYAYQLFAGNYVPHVIMLVSGQYDNDEYFLGWLTFNYFTDNENGGVRITSVENNKIYKIGLAGIAVNKKDITVDPELMIFDLGLKCTIAAWTVKYVTPGIE